MSIEGLGKKFQEAREARGLTLDEAARMTKIRPSRLAEIEADDFSQFPSLAYAKGFLLIYGKFLDVDVSEYLDVFETSSQVTVDGYSYLQDAPAPKPHRDRAPVIRHRPIKSERSSPWPVLIGIGAIVVGFLLMQFVSKLQRIQPKTIGVAETSPTASAAAIPSPSIAPPAPVAQAASRAPSSSPPVVAEAKKSPTSEATVAQWITPPEAFVPAFANANAAAKTNAAPSPKEPEIRRAEPVRPEDLAKTGTAETPAESGGPNRVAIKPLRKTYIKVVIDNDVSTPPFERWISPSDGVMEFRGQHIAVRVLDRDAIQIKKNGKSIAEGDTDVTVE
ncbi:MAG TPA: helix-turn-helix domain-containing protein [Chthoniobacterales bacterium]|nr:helix-turn-helix domain-containing protein [Chthoniobacterales bacterium]